MIPRIFQIEDACDFSTANDCVVSIPTRGQKGFIQRYSQEGVPGRRKRQPAPVFLAGESHGQRSLAGYGPWGRVADKGPHLAMTREARGFSRVVVGFSSYDGEFRLPLVLAQEV